MRKYYKKQIQNNVSKSYDLFMRSFTEIFQNRIVWKISSGNGVLDNLVQIKIYDSQLVIMKLHKFFVNDRKTVSGFEFERIDFNNFRLLKSNMKSKINHFCRIYLTVTLPRVRQKSQNRFSSIIWLVPFCSFTLNSKDIILFKIPWFPTH